ncbi:hypothetical protein P5673_012741 [Acropora cervicornis]|uniref:Uncharacterized protein n=1 Tax=Acropora cervicornis TaxID=6130 RepID=A0AAD9QM32_ACRCE|nr:hypothetical protein P5673_012741 [Acropora cervicornis]
MGVEFHFSSLVLAVPFKRASVTLMATKNQLALLLLICAVTALFIQPAVGQKDALRWGKRGSELSDDYVENPRTFQRYHHDDDYSRRFFHKDLGSNITDP